MNTAIQTGIKSPSVGNGELYVLKSPYNGHRYVVASVAQTSRHNTCETMVFPANRYGEVEDFGELAAVAGMNVSGAFAQIGYAVQPMNRKDEAEKVQRFLRRVFGAW